MLDPPEGKRGGVHRHLPKKKGGHPIGHRTTQRKEGRVVCKKGKQGVRKSLLLLDGKKGKL